MRLSRFLLPLAVLALTLPAYGALTGTWSGSFSASVACEDAGTVQISGPVTAYVVDFSPDAAVLSENVFAATLNAEAAVPDVVDCQAGPVTTIPMFMSGDINGSSLTAELFLPSFELYELTGSVSGETMTLTGPGDLGGSVTLTVTRTSTQTPDLRHNGEYAGSYSFSANYSDRCSNVGMVTSSGAMTGSVFHVGEGGFLVVDLTNFILVVENEDEAGTCVQIGPDTFPMLFLATIRGSTITGFGGFLVDIFPFSGTIAGGVLSVTMPQPGGSLSFTMQMTSSLPPPGVHSFIANPPSIQPGQSSTLSWTTDRADTVTIDNGIGQQPANGSVVVSPTATTLYTLTATGPGGSTQGRVTVTVVQPTPRVVIGSLPSGMVQAAGQGGATDTFTVSNIGEGPTTVTLSPSGSFFTIAPTSFTLAAEQSQTVTITGLAQPAGTYEGTITGTGNGVPANASVPVRLLSAAAPTGTVQPRATTSREEISSAPGENPIGTVEFTNSGTATMVAMAVADVVWIDPQDGVITIPPGQTVSVSYQIISALRPDGSQPLGAAVGKISLVFITGSTSGPTVAGGGGPPTSTVSVTLVHVAKPGVSAATPPPLAPGELALFVSGLGNRPTATGDLLLANRFGAALTGFQLFVQGAGTPSLTASISQLVANSSVALPGLMKNVFNSSSVSSGTAQIRGADASKASVAAIQTNTSSPAGTYSTALPVFRSDRTVASAGTIVLSGLQKGATSQTDVFVQETAGSAGSFQIDFLDNRGVVVGSRPSEAVASFGFSELFDVVPSNATAARITNTSGTARLAAYALVTNPATGDGWLVTDPSAGSTTDDAFIVPVFSAGTGASTILYTTNRSAAPANVTIDVRSSTPSRRRAVGRSSSTPPLAVSPDATPVTLAPAETTSMSLAAIAGYVRVSGPAGAISAAGRSVRSSGSSVFGSGLPAVPVSAALRSGEAKRFGGVEDASTVSRATAVPATFRSSLALVETNNQSVSVKVVLQFSFSGGSLVSSTARVTKDYTLTPGSYLLISDLGREIIGPSRESFGDLRNMTLDVEVVSGSGRVIPFLQAIDNGSGDMIVRIE